MYSCAVETSYHLLWKYTLNGVTDSHPFVFNDPVTNAVINLGPLELALKSAVQKGSSVGNIMSTATIANGLTTANNGTVISCASVENTSPEIIISLAG